MWIWPLPAMGLEPSRRAQGSGLISTIWGLFSVHRNRSTGCALRLFQMRAPWPGIEPASSNFASRCKLCSGVGIANGDNRRGTVPVCTRHGGRCRLLLRTRYLQRYEALRSLKGGRTRQNRIDALEGKKDPCSWCPVFSCCPLFLATRSHKVRAPFDPSMQRRLFIVSGVHCKRDCMRSAAAAAARWGRRAAARTLVVGSQCFAGERSRTCIPHRNILERYVRERPYTA